MKEQPRVLHFNPGQIGDPQSMALRMQAAQKRRPFGGLKTSNTKHPIRKSSHATYYEDIISPEAVKCRTRREDVPTALSPPSAPETCAGKSAPHEQNKCRAPRCTFLCEACIASAPVLHLFCLVSLAFRQYSHCTCSTLA